MSNKIIIVGLGVILVVGVGALSVMEMLSHPKRDAQLTQPEMPKVAYVEIRQMTLRLADAASEHYMKIDPVLAVRARDAQAVEDKIPVVRDRIVTVVTARSSAELSSPNGERKLKEDLVTALHRDFPDSLVDVYFSDYLVE